MSITVHQRRAARKERERVITLFDKREVFKFCRGDRLGYSLTAAVFRVDYHRGLLHVTVPVMPETLL